jgi:hypothetical protein
MKRTGFARKGFTGNNYGPRHISEVLAEMADPAPIKASPLFRLPQPITAMGQQALKVEPLRSEQYRRYVASFPCAHCGLVGSSQCAHANKGKGLAMKTCDRRTFPACFRCHSDIDNSRGMTREQRRDLEERYVARMQAQARTDNRPEFR